MKSAGPGDQTRTAFTAAASQASVSLGRTQPEGMGNNDVTEHSHLAQQQSHMPCR